MAEKERIIPITVPINPISVATEASVDRITKFLESIGSSRDVASSNSFLRLSTFCSLFISLSSQTDSYFTKPARTTFAKEPLCLSHSSTALALPSLEPNNSFILLTNLFDFPFPLAIDRVTNRSIEKIIIIKFIATKIGTIKPPL